MHMRRTMTILASSLAVWGLPVAAGHADTSAPPQQPAAADGSVRADFNGDGFADLAVGVPYEDAGRVVDAGAVNVQYGSATGLTTRPGQIFTQVAGLPEAGDLFGYALASGDFNSDGIPDLAVGAPGEDVGSVSDAGAVSVLYGSTTGLTTANARLFTQVGSAPETADLFGYTLAAGDFNHDGFTDLAAAAPNEGVFSVVGAGAVSVLNGPLTPPVGGQIITQNSPGVGSSAETDDFFGVALATAASAPASPTAGSVTAAGAATTTAAKLEQARHPAG
jgi:hypothetical protein